MSAEQVLRELIVQVDLDCNRPYWEPRWANAGGAEIKAWLESLIDHGWPERFETPLKEPDRVLVALVSCSDGRARQGVVGVSTTLSRAMQECALLHLRILGRASLRWVNDIDEDTGIQHGWIGTDAQLPEWRYEILNLAQYGGTP